MNIMQYLSPVECSKDQGCHLLVNKAGDSLDPCCIPRYPDIAFSSHTRTSPPPISYADYYMAVTEADNCYVTMNAFTPMASCRHDYRRPDAVLDHVICRLIMSLACHESHSKHYLLSLLLVTWQISVNCWCIYVILTRCIQPLQRL